MWTGRIPYGKCDIVDGECFVATEFQHIAWLPVIPIRTWVIVDDSIESHDDYVGSFSLRWEGAPIRFSFKSLLYAWFRALLLLCVVAAAFVGVFITIMWIAGRTPILETVVVVGSALSALVLYRLSVVLARASESRADYLRDVIARKYGQP
jgi:hypothetical protein